MTPPTILGEKRGSCTLDVLRVTGRPDLTYIYQRSATAASLDWKLVLVGNTGEVEAARHQAFLFGPIESEPTDCGQWIGG
jgi:hypothetical protein